MKLVVYSAKPFEIPLLEQANQGVHELQFTPERLTIHTAHLAFSADAISIFSADDASAEVLEAFRDSRLKYITLRSAGYDNINREVARRMGFKIANVPDYSPHAIAEHAITLFMAFNRNIITAHHHALEHNFLLDSLIGFDLFRKKVGVLGTGRIGSVLVKILHGFGCEIVANDTNSDKFLIDNYNVTYVSKDSICNEAEVIFICLPLTNSTRYLLNADLLAKFKKNPIIVNIARGAVVDTQAMLQALDEGTISGYATDVYEKEHGVFFYDHSQNTLTDSLLQQLLNHPKVLLTPHQAFATKEALKNIADTTLNNIHAWAQQKHPASEIF